jgi:hypothetical protein
MQKSPVIIDALIERPEMYQQMVSESTRQIPGSVQYVIKRFVKPQDWMQEDTGMFKYHYESEASEKNYLELRFCFAGQVYVGNMLMSVINVKYMRRLIAMKNWKALML